MRSDGTVNELRSQVAGEVRAEMARQRVSQQQLARQLGVAQQTLSRRLTGEVAIDVDMLDQLAQVLRVPVSRFLPAKAA